MKKLLGAFKYTEDHLPHELFKLKKCNRQPVVIVDFYLILSIYWAFSSQFSLINQFTPVNKWLNFQFKYQLLFLFFPPSWSQEFAKQLGTKVRLVLFSLQLIQWMSIQAKQAAFFPNPKMNSKGLQTVWYTESFMIST